MRFLYRVCKRLQQDGDSRDCVVETTSSRLGGFAARAFFVACLLSAPVPALAQVNATCADDGSSSKKLCNDINSAGISYNDVGLTQVTIDDTVTGTANVSSNPAVLLRDVGSFGNAGSSSSLPSGYVTLGTDSDGDGIPDLARDADNDGNADLDDDDNYVEVITDTVSLVNSGTSGGNTGSAASDLVLTNRAAINAAGGGLQAIARGGDGGNGGTYTILGLYTKGRDGGNGNAGGSVTVNNSGAITANGVGVLARSEAGDGGDGGNAGGVVADSGDGGDGGKGGTVNVNLLLGSDIRTSGTDAIGVLAESLGGDGGRGGGAGGVAALGGNAGDGGDGGNVTVNNFGSVSTQGENAYGIYARSYGDSGGSGGGSGGLYADGGNGGSFADGGTVDVKNLGGSVTTDGEGARGIIAQSVGGGGGDGGSAGGLFTVGGKAGSGGDGKKVTVEQDATGSVETMQDDSSAIVGQSIGGGGGNGGNAVSVSTVVSVAVGGPGGDGGQVYIDADGTLTTHGDESNGILAQSIGGGGGNGGFAFAGNVPIVPGAPGVSVAVGGSGEEGGDADYVEVISNADISTGGKRSSGVVAQSLGGGGGNGGAAVTATISQGASVNVSVAGGGDGGGSGGEVLVDMQSGSVTTIGDNSHGVFAQSVGGGGGSGGLSVSAAISAGNVGVSLGGAGGAGGDGGATTVQSAAAIDTTGDGSYGILAQSIGGGGGEGGLSVSAGLSASASINVGLGGAGATGGSGGPVDVDNTGRIITRGVNSYGVLAQSVGGGGGAGGNTISASGAGGPVAGSVAIALGGDGGGGGTGGEIRLDNTKADASTTDADITTLEAGSTALIAQSIGGGGGSGGYAVAGTLTISKDGGGSVSVALGGDGGNGGTSGAATLNNSGVLDTSGDAASGIVAQSIGGAGGVGGTAVSGALNFSKGSGIAVAVGLGGNGGSGGVADTVEVTNDGAITTRGADAYGILAQSIGGAGGVGGMSIAGALNGTSGAGGSVSVSLGGAGGPGGEAGTVSVTNNAQIITQGARSGGVVAQSIGGEGGAGGLSVGLSLSGSQAQTGAVAVSLGGSGGGGGTAKAVNLTNTASVSTSGGSNTNAEGERVNTDAHALLAQSIGGSGGAGGIGGAAAVAVGKEQTASASIAVGGGGGDGGTAGNVTVSNSGDLSTGSDNSIGIVAQSIGGGGGAGGGSVALSFAFSQASNSGAVGVSVGGGGGAGVEAGTVDVDSTGNITTLGDSAYGILAQSIGGDGGQGGFSVAATGTMSREVSGAVGVSVGGFGGTGGKAKKVTVGATQAIDGTISTAGDNATAILAQSIGGGGGAGGFAGSLTGVVNQGKDKRTMALGVTVGGFGGSGGQAGDVEVKTAADAVIATKGDFAYGIHAQSVGGKGGNGGGALGAVINAATGGNSSVNAALTVGGFGGEGAVAGDVTVDNAGTIITGTSSDAYAGQFAHGILAQSIGGDGGAGGFSGSIAFAVGASNQSSNNYNLSASVGGFGGTGADAGMVSVDNTRTIITYGERARGIFAQSVGGGGGAGGDTGLGDDIWGEDFILDTTAQNVLAGDFDAVADSLGGGAYAGGYGANSHSIAASVGGFGGAGGDGDTVEVDNASQIWTFGFAGHGIFAQSVGGGGGQGGISTAATAAAAASRSTSISLAVGGFGGAGGDGGDVIVENDGQIVTINGGAFGIFGQSVGGGGGDGGDTRGFTLQRKDETLEKENLKPGKQLTVTVGGFGGVGGDSGTVDISNSGNIFTFGTGSVGIFAQTVGGGGGNGGSSSVSSKELAALFENDQTVKKHFRSQKYKLALGGFGGAGGTAKQVTVTNSGAIQTEGEQATGIYVQAVGGGGGTGGKASTGFSGDISVGGWGGAAGDGGTVVVSNTGFISTLGNLSDGIFAQSVGGGGGDGGAADFGDARSARAEMIKALRKGKGNVKTALTEFAKKVFLPTFGVGVGGFGGAAGDGGTVVVCNGADYDGGGCSGSYDTATISTTGNAAHGIFAQSVGGGGGTGGQAYLTNVGKIGIGGLGGAAGDGGSVTVVNNGDIVTQGNGSYGVFAQSVGGGGGLAGDITFGIEDFGRDEAKLVRNFVEYQTAGDVEGIDLDGDGTVTAAEQTATEQMYGFGSGASGEDIDLDQNGLPISDELLAQVTALLAAGSSGSTSDPLGFTNADPLNGQDATDAALESGITDALSDALAQAGADMKEAIVSGLKEAYAGTGIDAQIDSLTDSEFVEFMQKAFTTDGTSITLSTGKVFDFLNGITGDGGEVSVTTNGTIYVTGGMSDDLEERAGSIGIFAQSVGGGGGIVGNTIEVTEAEVDTDLNFDGDKDDTFDISDGTAFAGTVGGKGKGGTVYVNHTGSIIAPSLNGIGIFAQSTGGDGGSTVTVEVDGGTIQGGELYDDGTGIAAAVVIDGGDSSNTLSIGADSLLYAVGEQVILGGDETETVTSSGHVIGNIDLDYHGTAANANDYFNLAGGILETRTKINLAGGLLSNAGTLDVGGFGVVTTTVMDGNFEQTDTGDYLGDFNFGVAVSDLLEHNGTTTVDGLVTPNLITLARLAPPETFIRGATAAVDNGMDAVDTLTVDFGVIIDDVEVQLGIDGIDFTPDSADLTINQTAAGNFINTILQGDGSEDLGTFFAYLGNLKVGEEDELARVLQRIHPEAYAAMLAPQLFSAQRFGNLLQSCSVTGDNAGAVIKEGQCVWARASGAYFDKDDSFEFSNVRETSYAFSAGTQLVVAPNWRLGAALEYEETDFDVGDLASGEGERFNFGGVLKCQEGSWLLSATAAGGYAWNDVTRYVNLGNIVSYADIAQGNADISHAHLQLRAAQIFHSGSFYAKPYVDVTATYLYTHGFAETGAGALNLHVQSSGEWVFAASPTLELGAQFTDPGTGVQLRPYLRAGVTQFSESTLGVNATWDGAPASAGTFSGISDLDRTIGNFAAGLDIVDPTDKFDLRLNYEGRFGNDNIESHSGSVRAGIRY
jgi:hypothetical protein